MKSDYYVYCYFHPCGAPCYIGKGRGDRWKAHLTKSACHNSHLRRIVTKAGGEIPHVKLHVGLTNERATEYEIALISAIGRKPNGPLVNMTDGGEGIVGISDSTRRLLSEKAARRKWSVEQRAMLSAAHIGKTQSPESIAKRKASNTGKTRSMETRMKMSVSMKGLKRSMAARANMSSAHVGKKLTPNARKSALANLEKRWNRNKVA